MTLKHRLGASIASSAVLILLLGLALHSAAAGDTGSRGPRMVLVPHDNPAYGHLGGRLIARYSDLSLVEVDAARLASIAPDLAPRDDIHKLQLTAGSFDTRFAPGLQGIPSRLRDRLQPGQARLYLVQFVGPVKKEWLDRVRSAGAAPVHAFPVDGYTVWASSAAADRLRAMAGDKAFLQFVGAYHPYYKLEPELARRLDTGAGRKVRTVTVQRYAHAGRTGTRNLVRDLARKVLVGWWPVLGYENTRIQIRSDRIELLAHQPDVVWIEEWAAPERLDEVQDQIIAGALTPDNTGPIGPGYRTWLLAQGFSTDPTQYPIVDVTDDGIGGGNPPTQPTSPPTGTARWTRASSTASPATRASRTTGAVPTATGTSMRASSEDLTPGPELRSRTSTASTSVRA